MAEDGELSRDGKAGGGLETIYAGGMHNLAIDEAGKVRPIVLIGLGGWADNRSVHGESTIMPLLDESLRTSPILKLGLLFLMRIWRLIHMSLKLFRRKDLGLYRLLLGTVSVWLLMPRGKLGHGVLSEYVPPTCRN
jgi:hypothetical protein